MCRDVLLQIVLVKLTLNLFNVVLGFKQVSVKFLGFCGQLLFLKSQTVDFFEQDDNSQVEFTCFEDQSLVVNSRLRGRWLGFFLCSDSFFGYSLNALLQSPVYLL